jgi:tetratricopeptide (TPR) repeat protein
MVSVPSPARVAAGTELARRGARQGEPGAANANRLAAELWQWRVRVWPQDQTADIHDLLEARHHLLQAGDTEDAGQVTERICWQLHTRGAWDQEYGLIQDTLTRLHAVSACRATLLNQAGTVARDRGDYDEAARQYQASLVIRKRLGNEESVIGSYYQLGNIAYLRADYETAARQYQRSLDINERLGDQAGMATSYGQLANLEAERSGNTAQAIGLHVQALEIRLRLGVPQAVNNLRRLAAHRDELGPERFGSLLAQATGDANQAETILSLLGQLGPADADSG